METGASRESFKMPQMLRSQELMLYYFNFVAHCSQSNPI